jgi:hypothetical protein
MPIPHLPAESQGFENLLNAAVESLIHPSAIYDKGAADILEVLNTHSALADAQQERIRIWRVEVRKTQASGQCRLMGKMRWKGEP